MTRPVNIAHRFDRFGNEVQIFHADKGEGLPKHEHAWDHVTFCMAGSCVIRKENREVVVNKYTQPINLVANEWHEIEAIEDGTVFCNVFGKQE
jgi:quercetin dioxygenase-like cupin family protein